MSATRRPREEEIPPETRHEVSSPPERVNSAAKVVRVRVSPGTYHANSAPVQTLVLRAAWSVFWQRCRKSETGGMRERGRA